MPRLKQGAYHRIYGRDQSVEVLTGGTLMGPISEGLKRHRKDGTGLIMIPCPSNAAHCGSAIDKKWRRGAIPWLVALAHKKTILRALLKLECALWVQTVMCAFLWNDSSHRVKRCTVRSSTEG